MKAVVYEEYGSPELRDVEPPPITDDDVLVRVRACSVNPLDWYFLSGTMYLGRLITGLRKPRRPRLGVDFAGTVEAVGGNVKRFRPGDEVFGGARGAFAEQVCAAEHRVALKPARLTFEQAAAVPVAGLTALQALRDKGQIRAGQKVLINGASGGVGTFAVQIARAFGADVTGVCSTRHVDLVRSIGAARVIDYTREDFTRSDQRYDLMLDTVGSRSWSDCKRVLAPQATVVVVGGPKTNRWLGPLGHLAWFRLDSLFDRRRVILFVASLNQKDLAALNELFEAGTVTPVIDRRYDLGEISEALAYLGEGHAGGKVVITVSADRRVSREENH